MVKWDTTTIFLVALTKRTMALRQGGNLCASVSGYNTLWVDGGPVIWGDYYKSISFFFI